MFHNTDDEARINMPPRNTNHLPFNTQDFVEMVWENNTLVMQQKRSAPPAGCSSGFSDFLLLDNITENVNPRAVPDHETDNLYGTINYHFSKNHNNKRGREEPTIQAVEQNKKLKATIITPPPQGGDDSLVPDDTPIAAAASPSTDVIKRKKTMINESSNNDHLVPGPDMSIAASNDIIAPPCCTTDTHTTYQHSDSSSSSSYLPETQQWSDESARRSRWNNYNRRNRSSLVHTRSEKKRRDRINKKMRALQVLLPTTNKVVVDKASVLDEAIEYVKSLQLQLQLLSTPMMMPQFPMNQFSAAMGLGMAPHQFPMHGFPQMSCFPYMPFFGGPVVQAETTTSVDQIGSNPPPMSGSNHSSYPNDFSQMGFESELRRNK